MSVTNALTVSPLDVRSIKTEVHSLRRSAAKVRAQEVYAELSQPL